MHSCRDYAVIQNSHKYTLPKFIKKHFVLINDWCYAVGAKLGEKLDINDELVFCVAELEGLFIYL